MVRPTKEAQIPFLKEKIKALAWQQLAAVGAGSMSLRAIARDLGVSAPAIYNHYADRDALVTALIVDAYTSLGDHQRAALATVPISDPRGRLRATGRAYRAWAVTLPQRYQLIFGTPIPGYHAPTTVMPVAGHSYNHSVQVIDELASAGVLRHRTLPTVMHATQPQVADWQQHTGARSTHTFTIALTIWGRVHGMVSLEIAHAIPPFGPAGDALYEYELDSIAEEYIADS